ncbi:hypothetical protein Cabys_2436 [Caldithrix abyssi DSM 13497]|uniref:Uncharacterized protein n=1 Tax=Caldithrix abyssi DSM 13497 TaxID=880073 RepID=A0A1J1CA76_CALAY|nr:hypothetical protein Cabys_2436 [Caldithrix abyssi DSM 13497]
MKLKNYFKNVQDSSGMLEIKIKIGLNTRWLILSVNRYFLINRF